MPALPQPAARDLNAPHADRQRHARVEHDQWLKDHPNFSSQELLENWRRIREAWGLTHHPRVPGPPGELARAVGGRTGGGYGLPDARGTDP